MLLQIAGKEYPRLLQRYAKLPDANIDKIEAIADEYLSGTVKSSALPLLGGVGIGLYVGSVSTLPIVGAIAGGGLVYQAISGAIEKGRNAQYIKDAGIIAPFLKEHDLLAYADLVGVDAVVAEVNQAYQDQQKVSPAARRFMRQMGQPLRRRTIAHYVNALQAETPATIESTNQKNALSQVAYPQTTTQKTSQEVGPAQDASPIISRDVVDVAGGLAGRFRPSVITARPRVGKSLMVSAAMALLKQHGVTIWVIQPKPSPQELAYWKHADRFLGFWAESLPQDDEAMIDRMTTFIQEWRSQVHRPTLLFIDEGLMLEAKFPKWFKNDFKAQIVVEGSSGETDKRILWVATQSPLVTDLGLTTGKRSAFDLVTLQKADTTDHAHMVRSSYKSIEAIPDRSDFAASPVGSMIYHSAVGLWCAVPQLPLPTITPTDQLCPELEAFAHPKPAYAVVTSAPALKAEIGEPPPLPIEWEAIGRAMVAMNFPTEQPGTINLDGTKQPLNPKTDPIETAILEFLKSRPEGATAGRMRADKYALKTLSINELEEYLSVLGEEGKVIRNGNLYRLI